MGHLSGLGSLAACLWVGEDQVIKNPLFLFPLSLPKCQPREHKVFYAANSSLLRFLPSFKLGSQGAGGLYGAETLFAMFWAPDTGQSRLLGMLLAAFPPQRSCTQHAHNPAHKMSQGSCKSSRASVPTAQVFPRAPDQTHVGQERASAPPAHLTLPKSMAPGLSLPRGTGKWAPQAVTGCCPPSPLPPPKSCLYLLALVDSPLPGAAPPSMPKPTPSETCTRTCVNDVSLGLFVVFVLGFCCFFFF